MTTWLLPLIENATKQKDIQAPWLDGFSPIFIYGAGTFAQDVHRTLIDNGLPVYGFIDHVMREYPFMYGMPIYTPEKAAEIASASGKAIVVLGIHNYQADISKIIERLTSVGFKKILNSVDLYDFFGRELGVRYWLTSRDYYFSLQTVLEEMYSLWADDASKSLFRAVVEFRLTGDATKLPAPDLINPYRPTDIPAWKAPLRFVDCGAFDGDTLADLLKNKMVIQAVAAFEPDLINYAKLSRFVSSHKKELPEANLFPCGVYSSTTQLAFETGQGMASNISSKGNTIIQCVALDNAIPTLAPNLIKMDIEGAEYDALLGARQIISAHTPGLAVSLYHRPEHLWQLPMLVESIAPGKYKFYMRSHAMNDFELVLYAVPVEQGE
jgi:FkbM family methyltransferase